MVKIYSSDLWGLFFKMLYNECYCYWFYREWNKDGDILLKNNIYAGSMIFSRSFRIVRGFFWSCIRCFVTVECRPNSYRSATANECLECPANSQTFGRGAASIAECHCLPGFSGDFTRDETCKGTKYRYHLLTTQCLWPSHIKNLHVVVKILFLYLRALYFTPMLRMLKFSSCAQPTCLGQYDVTLYLRVYILMVTIFSPFFLRHWWMWARQRRL